MPEKMFTAEHLLRLSDRGLIPTFPLELSPVPVRTTDDETLDRDLEDWEIVRDGELDPEMETLFRLLAHSPVRVWGALRFPAHAEDIHYDLSEIPSEWGIEETQTIVPRVPMMVSVSDEYVVMSQSTPEALTVHLHPRTRDMSEDISRAIFTMLDPGSEWKPRPMPRITVPATAVQGGAAGLADALANQPGAKVAELRELAQEPLYAVLALTATVTTDQGERDVDAAVALILSASETPYLTLASSGVSPLGTSTLSWEGATPDALTRAIAGLIGSGTFRS